jgi:hypothetical protein
MVDGRREYPFSITLNGRLFTRVVIDPHYEENHPDITDQLILNLIQLLDGTQSDPVSRKDGFVYLAQEISWKEKSYRLVLTYCDEDFLGVINAFRVKEKKL